MTKVEKPIEKAQIDSQNPIAPRDIKKGEEVSIVYSSIWSPAYGFPHMQTVGFFWKKQVPNGWEDRGLVDVDVKYLGDGYTQDIYPGCPDCNSQLHVGRENEKGFLFCPKCLVKLDKKEAV